MRRPVLVSTRSTAAAGSPPLHHDTPNSHTRQQRDIQQHESARAPARPRLAQIHSHVHVRDPPANQPAARRAAHPSRRHSSRARHSVDDPTRSRALATARANDIREARPGVTAQKPRRAIGASRRVRARRRREHFVTSGRRRHVMDAGTLGPARRVSHSRFPRERREHAGGSRDSRGQVATGRPVASHSSSKRRVILATSGEAAKEYTDPRCMGAAGPRSADRGARAGPRRRRRPPGEPLHVAAGRCSRLRPCAHVISAAGGSRDDRDARECPTPGAGRITPRARATREGVPLRHRRADPEPQPRPRRARPRTHA